MKKIKSKTIKHGPNWMDLDGRSGDITAVAITGSECVSITTHGRNDGETHDTWVQITLSTEDAIRLANDILKRAV